MKPSERIEWERWAGNTISREEWDADPRYAANPYYKIAAIIRYLDEEAEKQGAA